MSEVGHLVHRFRASERRDGALTRAPARDESGDADVAADQEASSAQVSRSSDTSTRTASVLSECKTPL